MVSRWTFKDYLSAEGENVFHAWLNGLPKAAKAKINAMLRYIEPMQELGPPQLKRLKGPCAGLMEVRVRGADNIQYRPLCCHGPGDGEITLLAGAIEKGSKFVPLSACSTAHMRQKEITERGRTCDHNFS